MKVVVAMDSFKGSIPSMEAGMAVKKGILAAHPSAVVVVRPLADGGEGTADALTGCLNGNLIHLSVTGPMEETVDAHYGYLPDLNTAVIETAAAAGITLSKEKNPLKATTYGLGEMIAHAMDRGIRNFIIGLGGSCTNDGGIGMLKALGYHFLDKHGKDVGNGALALSKIASVEPSDRCDLLLQCRFQVACDVNNPLCGPYGATVVYGSQKGITPALAPAIDAGMESFSKITARLFHKDFSCTPGAGAAGGLGFAFLSYLNGELVSGIQLFLETSQLEQELIDADFVVTGEGRLDHQTAMGKAPVGVAKMAKKYHAKTIAFAGSVSKDAALCNQEGIDAFFPILRGVSTLEVAMNPDVTRENLAAAAEQVFRLL